MTEKHRFLVTGLKACVVTDNLIIFRFVSEAKEKQQEPCLWEVTTQETAAF